MPSEVSSIVHDTLVIAVPILLAVSPLLERRINKRPNTDQLISASKRVDSGLIYWCRRSSFLTQGEAGHDLRHTAVTRLLEGGCVVSDRGQPPWVESEHDHEDGEVTGTSVARPIVMPSLRSILQLEAKTGAPKWAQRPQPQKLRKL